MKRPGLVEGPSGYAKDLTARLLAADPEAGPRPTLERLPPKLLLALAQDAERAARHKYAMELTGRW